MHVQSCVQATHRLILEAAKSDDKSECCQREFRVLAVRAQAPAAPVAVYAPMCSLCRYLSVVTSDC